MPRPIPRRPRTAVALLALLAGALQACADCESEVEVTAFDGPDPDALAVDVWWSNEWLRSWIAFGKDAEHAEGSPGFLEKPRRACRTADDDEIVAIDSVRVVWDPSDLHDDLVFETSINDGYEGGLAVPIVEGEARAALIGTTKDGDERVLGTSAPFFTGFLPTCEVDGPLVGEGGLATGASLRVPLLGGRCDPSAFDAFVDTPEGRVPADADLADGSVDLVVGAWASAALVLEPNATAPERTRASYGPAFTASAEGTGRCGPILGPVRAAAPDGPPFQPGEVLVVDVVDPSACATFVDAGGILAAVVLRGVDAPTTGTVAVTQVGDDALQFEVPFLPAGDYVLSFDQGVASLESAPFAVAEPDPLGCVLPGPVEGTTLFAGEVQQIPIGNAATCDVSAFTSAVLCLDAGDPSPPPCTTLEDAAGLADGTIDFTIPLTSAWSDDARIVLRGDDDVTSPSFHVDFVPCGLTALVEGSLLEIGADLSVPVDDGDRCVPDRRYDGAWLRSVDDPSGFAPVELDADLADGTVDFEVPDVPEGTYTVGLGAQALDALTSEPIEIAPVGTGGEACAIQVDAPAAGAQVDAGDPIGVVWWSDCGIPLDVVLMKGPFPITSPVTIAEDEPDDGAATVTIPVETVGGTDYRLCVQTPDGASVDCSAPFRVKAVCVPSSTLTWTPTGSSTPTALADVTPSTTTGVILLAIRQTGVSTPSWGGAIFATGLSPGQTLTQATGNPFPDAPGESMWAADDNTTYPPQATSSSVTGTVAAWDGERLEVTNLSAAITVGNASYTGTLAGSFTVCLP